MEITARQFLLFLLLFARTTSLLVAAPFFGHQAVPVQVKAGLGAFLALVLLPLAGSGAPEVDLALLPLTLLALQEVLVGLVIGFAAGLVFAGARAAGELVGFELGFSIANIFDPETGQSNGVVGQVFYLSLVLVFLLVNGHHFVLQSIQLSYAVVPFGGAGVTPQLTERLVAMAGQVFVVAVKLAAPVIVASFLVNLGLAILARVSPQMNVFLLGFPVKIAVGMLVLAASAPVMIAAFKQLLAAFEQNMVDLVRAM